MNKRTYLILLVIGAIVAVGLVIFYFLWPRDTQTPVTQPPPVDRAPAQPFDPSRPPTLEPSTEPAPDINDPAERERQAQEALKRQALDFASRQGSYSSVDEFAAIRQVYTQSTQELADFLEGERQTLIARYPAFGPSYGRTTRSLSAKILTGIPVLESGTAEVEVQAQVVTNSASGGETIGYERIVVSYTKSGNTWVASRVEASPLEL